MDMVSEQVRYLREFGYFGSVKAAMDEAADTIESLCQTASGEYRAGKGKLQYWNLSELIDKFDNEKIKGITDFEQVEIFNALKYLDMYQRVGTIAELMELKQNMERPADSKMIDGNKLLKDLEKETFTADLYEHGWDGQTVDNLLCLGDVKKVIDGYEPHQSQKLEE